MSRIWEGNLTRHGPGMIRNPKNVRKKKKYDYNAKGALVIMQREQVKPDGLLYC